MLFAVFDFAQDALSLILITIGGVLRGYGRRPFYPNRTLLEIGFARYRIECTQGDKVRVGLNKMEWHKNLTWRHDAGDTQFQVAHAVAARSNGDPVVRLQLKSLSICRIHLQP